MTARRGTDAADTLTDLGRAADRVPDGHESHLPPRTPRFPTGARLRQYVDGLTPGRSKDPRIRRVPSAADLEAIREGVRRYATAGSRPNYKGSEIFVLPDGTSVGYRINRGGEPTLDVYFSDGVTRKVHIGGL